jgi:hypothetical protein
MAKINWYIAAKGSDNEEVKNLLSQYDKSKEKEKKEDIRSKIIILLTPQSDEVVKEPQKEEVTEESNEKEEDITKQKIAKIKELRKEIEKLEHSRLKNSSFEENKELNAKIKVVSRQILTMRNELRAIRLSKKQEELRKNGAVSSIKIKQEKILKLLKDGISFSNIIKHSNGVSKDEIVQVVDNDPDFMQKMIKINKRLPLIWLQWKRKFIKIKR